MVDRVRRIGDPPLASVIIATRDRPASLACCLASLGQLAYPRTEIVVVDNCPTTDETAELVDRWTGTGQRIRYVREPRPGLAVAHNRGVQEARGDVLAFTDDDVLVDRWWLDELVAGFGAADGVGCVTGLITAAELETPAQVWAERHWGLGKGFTRTVVDLHDQRPPGRLFPYAAGTLGSGANMAFSAAALWSIGGFDAVLGTGTRAMGGDDLAAFYRTVVNGHGLVYEPAAIVRHSGHQGAAALRRQAYGYGVGLTAYLTSIVAHDPTTLARVLPRIPAAVGHAVSPRRPAPSPFVSPPGARPAPGVVARRWLGMACGPMAYARSRRWARRLDAFERMPSVSNASAATEDEACPPFPG